MTIPRLLPLGLVSLLLAAQTPQTPEPSSDAPIKVDVNLVTMLASVRSKQGAFINTLTKDDFDLTEEGHTQTIKYFSKETALPLTIGLLVDVSGSQERLIEIERQAASEFFHAALRPKDEAFLISFGADSELLQDITNSQSALQRGLDRLRLNAGTGGFGGGPVPTMSQPRGTVLYDTVYLAANDRLKTEAGRKVCVLITDGVDQGSRLSIDAAIEAAQKADTVIYSIYYVDPSAYGGRGLVFGGGGGEGYLKKMSEATGGRVFRVDRHNTLNDIFRQLNEEMRSQYLVSYTPAPEGAPGQYRRLDLHAKDKNLKVQARKGYYVAERDRR
jgi:VWFA-related protein